ncbi:MAG: FAD-dependent oxidoreductase [Halobacteriaceae archaeon]
MDEERIIVVGGGRVGVEAARHLSDRGHSVTVVERDAARCEDIGDEYVATVVEGDATDPDVLSQAAPGRADAVAALTGNNGTNLAVCLLVDRLSDAAVRTVARVDEARLSTAYEEVVDDVVFPERLGALAAVNAVVTPGVRALESFASYDGPFDVVLVDCDKQSYVDALELAVDELADGALVVADNMLAGPVTPAEVRAALVGEEPPSDHAAGIASYIERVRDDPAFDTSLLPLGEGIAVSQYRP